MTNLYLVYTWPTSYFFVLNTSFSMLFNFRLSHGRSLFPSGREPARYLNIIKPTGRLGTTSTSYFSTYLADAGAFWCVLRLSKTACVFEALLNIHIIYVLNLTAPSPWKARNHPLLSIRGYRIDKRKACRMNSDPPTERKLQRSRIFLTTTNERTNDVRPAALLPGPVRCLCSSEYHGRQRERRRATQY